MPPLFPVAAAAPGSLFFERCVIISARSVKMHYDLSTRNYKQNKQRAVEWAKQFVSTTPNAFEDGSLAAFRCSKKQDDLADSLLLLMYYLDTYSNQFTSSIVLNTADVLFG